MWPPVLSTTGVDLGGAKRSLWHRQSGALHAANLSLWRASLCRCLGPRHAWLQPIPGSPHTGQRSLWHRQSGALHAEEPREALDRRRSLRLNASPVTTHPTPWQRKLLWLAVSALSLAVLAVLSVQLIRMIGRTVGFLQPLLLPVALAAIMAFLLEPLVQWLGRRGVKRRRAVILVFALVSASALALLGWLVPVLYGQSVRFGTNLPDYTLKARDRILKLATDYGSKLALPPWRNDQRARPGASPSAQAADPTAIPEPTTSPAPPTAPATPVPSPGPELSLPPPVANPVVDQLSAWLNEQIPTVTAKVWGFIQQSVGGFLGVFGFLFSMVVVPLYLYYFLIESPQIAQRWSDYLPLRASHFKDEVVLCLTEINNYLIAFFRGQLLVSVINGVATGLGLLIIGLDFGLVIGLMLCVLGIIPYLGIMLCWVPAVIIAIVQGHSYLIPGGGWWLLPAVVTGVFFVIQQIDGLFITPRVVGESIGLHPVTVILSLFGWSLLLGGLLGALLAIPLTATLKVLLRRYVWDRKTGATPVPESEVSP